MPPGLGPASNQRQQDGFHLIIGVVTQQHMGKFLFGRDGEQRVVAGRAAAQD